MRGLVGANILAFLLALVIVLTGQTVEVAKVLGGHQTAAQTLRSTPLGHAESSDVTSEFATLFDESKADALGESSPTGLIQQVAAGEPQYKVGSNDASQGHVQMTVLEQGKQLAGVVFCSQPHLNATYICMAGMFDSSKVAYGETADLSSAQRAAVSNLTSGKTSQAPSTRGAATSKLPFQSAITSAEHVAGTP